MTIHIRGTGVSKGVGIGNATIIPRGHIHVSRHAIKKQQITGEIKRYQRALEEARNQLHDLRQLIPADMPADINSFIETHLLMLDDGAIIDAPIDIIKKESCNAEWALEQQYHLLVRVFDEVEDTYLRTRRDDIEHVVTRIQRILINEDPLLEFSSDKDLSSRIIVIDNLSPAETVTMQQQGIAGFVTEYGGPLSHTAILARSLGIPAIVGVQGVSRKISSGEHLIIDSDNNSLIVAPDKRVFNWYKNKQREFRRQQRLLRELKEQPATTLDGDKIELHANIELPDDLRAAKRAGCEGIGLFRTEYLFMNRESLPTEDEQFSAYRSVARKMKGATVTIRTLDLGADKQVDSASQEQVMATNPALGLRAVRLCLQDKELFRTQLRAIYRASAWGKIRIMIPMITTMQEIRQVRAHIDGVKEELTRSNTRFDDKVEIGTMIEVPAAALSASLFAQHCDFLSIGTNDLIQYTLAIDRMDDTVNYLYDPLHPAVLKLIKMVIDAGQEAEIPVSMCGEMAGDARYTRLLLGLGLKEFSMHPTSLLEVKEIVLKTTSKDIKKPVQKLLRTKHTSRMHDMLSQLNQIKLH